MTKDEMRDVFMSQVKAHVVYWKRPERIDEDPISGVVFSILNTLDGMGGLPAFDLVPRPHPDDKAFHEANGDDYWEGISINDECMLHELYYSND